MKSKQQSWLNNAIEANKDGRKDDAEIAAYEAGRYGGQVPATIATHQNLFSAFSRGAVDVVHDEIDAERAEAITPVAPHG